MGRPDALNTYLLIEQWRTGSRAGTHGYIFLVRNEL